MIDRSARPPPQEDMSSERASSAGPDINAVTETARRIKAWASGAHALAFNPVDDGRPRRADTPADLFRCIDPDHLGRELHARRITMVGVEPGGGAIVIATEKALPARSQPAATTTDEISLRFIKAGRPITSLPAAAIAPNPNQGMVGGVYTCGSSISPLTRDSTGTLGCLVRDRGGRLLGLSNNHVAGGCGFLEPRMPIIAPGLADAQPGGLDAFVIGHHVDFAPWKTGLPQILDVRQNLDLALFAIKDETAVSSMQGAHFDTPTAIASMARIKTRGPVRVSKVGRRTGLTRGTVTAAVTGDTSVAYDQPNFRSEVHYLDMITIHGASDTPFARPGDSGSLVVADVDGAPEALGIVFAVSHDEALTWVMPMEVVLAGLGVTIEGKINVPGSGSGGGP